MIFYFPNKIRKIFLFYIHEVLTAKFGKEVGEFFESLFRGEDRVKFGDHTSDPFIIDKGLIQGLALSPVVFCFLADPFLLILENEKIGDFLKGIFLSSFSYIDDISIFIRNL